MSVSYTHLDVYKRQLQGGGNVILNEEGTASFDPQLIAPNEEPVSYTHLDVYKRQFSPEPAT